MSAALFFRDVSNIEELKKLTSIGVGLLCEYSIIEKLDVSISEYEDFCKNLKQGYRFLQPYVESCKIIANKWNCVLICKGEEPAILVMMNGYQYPRFVALFCEKPK